MGRGLGEEIGRYYRNGEHNISKEIGGEKVRNKKGEREGELRERE